MSREFSLAGVREMQQKWESERFQVYEKCHVQLLVLKHSRLHERSLWVLRGSPQLTAYREMEPCSTTSMNYILPTIWWNLRASFFLESPERNTALLTHVEFNLERPKTQKFCWATPCLDSLTRRNWDNKWRLFQATMWLFSYRCNRKIMYLYSLSLWK